MRHYSSVDKFCLQLDGALKTLVPSAQLAARTNPAAEIVEATLTATEKRQAAALMRVNHVGEVCAQALYQGQILTATSPKTREKLQKAAAEELDHLVWCAQRITELDGHHSYLNLLWFAGSYALGAMAGAMGDRWSLGFLADTEQQVTEHLQTHLVKLPVHDYKTRAILEQMTVEEAEHATMAIAAGGTPLPLLARYVMRFTAKIMTTTAYYI